MRAFSGLANSVLTVTASGKHIIANAGTAIAGRIFGKAGFERFNSLPTELAHPANVYKLSDCIKAEVTSMCCGDPSFEGICDIRSDESFYAIALNMLHGIPSAERHFSVWISVRRQKSLSMFHNAAVLYSRDMIRDRDGLLEWLSPWDKYVTPFDESRSHKGNISRTYHNFVGYAPNYMYCGQEGFMVATEFRPGNQHCQKGTVAFIEQSIETIRDIYPVGKVLFRMDSGNDSLETSSHSWVRACTSSAGGISAPSRSMTGWIMRRSTLSQRTSYQASRIRGKGRPLPSDRHGLSGRTGKLPGIPGGSRCGRCMRSPSVRWSRTVSF